MFLEVKLFFFFFFGGMFWDHLWSPQNDSFLILTFGYFSKSVDFWMIWSGIIWMMQGIFDGIFPSILCLVGMRMVKTTQEFFWPKRKVELVVWVGVCQCVQAFSTAGHKGNNPTPTASLMDAFAAFALLFFLLVSMSNALPNIMLPASWVGMVANCWVPSGSHGSHRTMKKWTQTHKKEMTRDRQRRNIWAACLRMFSPTSGNAQDRQEHDFLLSFFGWLWMVWGYKYPWYFLFTSTGMMFSWLHVWEGQLCTAVDIWGGYSFAKALAPLRGHAQALCWGMV